LDLVFPWPASPGGWLAFLSAALTAVIGVAVLVSARNQERGDPLSILVHSRSLLASFLLANGLGCILLDQPLGYLVLGAAWSLAALARLIAMAVYRRAGAGELAVTVVAAALAALPLAHVLGYVQ